MLARDVRPIERALLVAALVLAATLLAVFPKWTVDDAYISFRYAANLARHGQLTWNVGEDPVEGYTGVALPTLLAGAMRLGIEPRDASRVIGVASLLAGGVLLWLLLRRLGAGGAVRGSVVLLYAAAPCVYPHALGGLETLLFSSILLGSLLALLARADSGGGPLRDARLLIAVLAAGLVRPEGAALAAAAAAALICLGRREGRLGPTALRILGWLVLPGGSYFLWRWGYYGQALPNTFYVKSDGGWSLDSALSLGRFVALYLALPLAAAMLPYLAAGRSPLRRLLAVGAGRLPLTARAIVTAAFVAFVATVLAQYQRSALEMNYSHRFFVPFLAPAFVALGLVAEAGLGEWREARREGRAAIGGLVPAAAGLVAVGLVAVWGAQLREELAFTADYRQLIEEQHLPAARFLRDAVPRDEWLAVHIDAGAIPFTSGLKTADFGRLNDEVLARGLSSRETVEYFYSYRPGAVVFTSYAWDALVRPQAESIYRDPRFSDYQLVRRYRTRADGRYGAYHEFVYLRRDLLEGAHLPD